MKNIRNIGYKMFLIIGIFSTAHANQNINFAYNGRNYSVSLANDDYTRKRCEYETQGWKQTKIPSTLNFNTAKEFLSSPCNPSNEIVNQLSASMDRQSPEWPLLLKAFSDSIRVEAIDDILTPFETVSALETNETGNFILYANLYFAAGNTLTKANTPLQSSPTRADGKPFWWQDPSDCGPGYIWDNGSCKVHCPPGQEMISYDGGPYKCQKPRPEIKKRDPSDRY